MLPQAPARQELWHLRAAKAPCNTPLMVASPALPRTCPTSAGHTNVVWSICMSKDGTKAISVSHDETIRMVCAGRVGHATWGQDHVWVAWQVVGAALLLPRMAPRLR